MAEVLDPSAARREAERKPDALWRQGLEFRSQSSGNSRIETLGADSAINPAGYGKVLKDKDLTVQAKAAYIAGRIAHDLLTDGTRIPYWALNHPLAQVSLLADLGSTYAGLSPDYVKWGEKLREQDLPASQEDVDDAFAKEMGFYRPGNNHKIPLTVSKNAIPAMAVGALTTLSNNTNYFNVLGGGRTPGFESVMPVEGNSRESSNPLLELGARYIFGRTGRVLPWEQFTAERPDVSQADYKDYAAYQFDKGPLGLGLVRGTTRNLDGEPEMTMLGFRVPLSAATSAAGTVAGAILAARAADDLNAKVFQGKLPKLEGPRRLAGAAIGGLLGGLLGKGGGVVANDLVLQPLINPERVAMEQAWIAQQQALGLL